MTIPWTLKIGMGIFVMTWVATALGWILQTVEWRRFTCGHATAARHGLVLSTRLAPTGLAACERVRVLSRGRAVSHDTLLFPVDLPYASGVAA